jgi:hypothetical protein
LCRIDLPEISAPNGRTFHLHYSQPPPPKNKKKKQKKSEKKGQASKRASDEEMNEEKASQEAASVLTSPPQPAAHAPLTPSSSSLPADLLARLDASCEQKQRIKDQWNIQ